MRSHGTGDVRAEGKRAWEALAAVVDGRLLAVIEAELDQQLIEACEAQAAAVGTWLVERGHAALWAELFAYLASEEGGSLGPWDQAESPLPQDAATRFLRRQAEGER